MEGTLFTYLNKDLEKSIIEYFNFPLDVAVVETPEILTLKVFMSSNNFVLWQWHLYKYALNDIDSDFKNFVSHNINKLLKKDVPQFFWRIDNLFFNAATSCPGLRLYEETLVISDRDTIFYIPSYLVEKFLFCIRDQMFTTKNVEEAKMKNEKWIR
jgi:hypothetical protein